MPKTTAHSTQTLSAHTQQITYANAPAQLEINNAFARCTISLWGGQVLSYQPLGQAPVLWLSEQAMLDGSKPIRGGIPICWPWFGPAATKGLPQHGFARSQLWRCDGVEETAEGTLVSLSLASNPTTLALWPHAFELRLTISIGQTLTVLLAVENTDDHAWDWSGALHTYLHVDDIQHVAVTGLAGDYWDSLTQQPGKHGDPLHVAAACDRIYPHPYAKVTVTDSTKAVAVKSLQHDSVVVWNPWEQGAKAMADMADSGYQQFLCVETAITQQPQHLAPDTEGVLVTELVPQSR